MHIAAATNTPLIAIYGASSSTYTPPLSDKAKKIQLDMHCSPCFKRECVFKHYNCLKQITPETIWQTIKKIISSLL